MICIILELPIFLLTSYNNTRYILARTSFKGYILRLIYDSYIIFKVKCIFNLSIVYISIRYIG